MLVLQRVDVVTTESDGSSGLTYSTAPVDLLFTMRPNGSFESSTT